MDNQNQTTNNPNIQGQQQITEKLPEQPEPEKVVVSKDSLTRVLAELDQLKKDNEMLKSVADRGRMATWEERHREEIRRKVRLRVFKGKVVVGWKMGEDVVEKNQQGIWQEKQDIELYYEDGEKQIVSYRAFSMQYDEMSAEIISRTETGGKVTFQVKADNGKKYTIADIFVN